MNFNQLKIIKANHQVNQKQFLTNITSIKLLKEACQVKEEEMHLFKKKKSSLQPYKSLNNPDTILKKGLLILEAMHLQKKIVDREQDHQIYLKLRIKTKKIKNLKKRRIMEKYQNICRDLIKKNKMKKCKKQLMLRMQRLLQEQEKCQKEKDKRCLKN